MKTWQIIIVMLVILFFLIGLLASPGGFGSGSDIWALVAVVSAIWVELDARKLQIQKYKTSFLGGTPLTRAIITFVIWPIALPFYISFRRKAKEGKIPLKNA